MVAYTRKVETVDAEQFLVASQPFPAGVSEITHPVLGRIHVLMTSTDRFRVQNTDWIVTLPDGRKVAMDNTAFTRTYQLAP